MSVSVCLSDALQCNAVQTFIKNVFAIHVGALLTLNGNCDIYYTTTVLTELLTAEPSKIL